MRAVAGRRHFGSESGKIPRDPCKTADLVEGADVSNAVTATDRPCIDRMRLAAALTSAAVVVVVVVTKHHQPQ